LFFNTPFIFLTNLRAQIYSVARIPKPSGMTMVAGPGRTIIATPIDNTVKPSTPMISLLSWVLS
jgi:hypothetical protein